MLPPVTWTEAAEEHIARHQVRPAEVEDVLTVNHTLPGRNSATPVFGTRGNVMNIDDLREHYDNNDQSAALANATWDTSTFDEPMVGITVRLPATTLN